MRIFRKGRGPYALAAAMAGVRMGERLVQVGADDPRMLAELAGKVGLSGSAVVVVDSERAAAGAERAAAAAGILVDVKRPLLPLPLGDAEFDVAILDATGPQVLGLPSADRLSVAREMHRVLRPGGRVLIVEREAGGIGGLFRGRPTGLDEDRQAGGGVGLLQLAGFRPVRLLAEREGQRFTEAWKGTP